MATGVVMRKGEGSGTYSYSSQPRVVEQKGKYREPEARPSNIMHDRRIVRGNTYALHSLPASTQPNPLELQRQQESRRRVLARKRVNEHLRIRSPPPVDGRKHIDIQTELYLEEITDRVEESDVYTQTDAFLDRPPTPLFIPAKTGMDAATQIEDGDLFDFDLEVKPILEVLVGKTVEQSLLEVMEEEELASLREQQRIFEENRNSELVETQRLEEQERRNREEKERRMVQQRQALLKEKETAEKVSARAFAQSYLSDLVPAVFTRLSDGGFFYDPVEREIETTFMPWLMDETDKIVNKQVVARQLLDVILRELIKKKLGMLEPESKVISESTEPVDGKETTGSDATTEKPSEEQKEMTEKKEVTEGEKMEEDGKTTETTTEQKPLTDDQSAEKLVTEETPGSEETKSDESKTEEQRTEPQEPLSEETTKTNEPKPEEPKSDDSKPEEPKTEEPKLDEPTSEEAKPEEPKPEDPKPEEPKPEEPKPDDPKPEEPKPEEPKPEDPKPEEPKPEEPLPEETKLEEPKPEESTPDHEEPKPEVLEEKTESEKPQEGAD